MIHDKWWLEPGYRYGEATFHPRGMTADELTGSPESNQSLSLERADGVRTYLINKGIPPEHITSQAFGENVQSHTNDTQIDQLSNRRVEFRVSPKSLVPNATEPVKQEALPKSQG